jgi:hypothetical protein
VSREKNQSVALALDPQPARELARRCFSGSDGEDAGDGGGVGWVAVTFEPPANCTGGERSGCSEQLVDIGRVDRGGEVLEQSIVVAQEASGAVEEYCDVPFGDVVEERQQFVTDPIATESRVVVRRVVSDIESEVKAQLDGLGAAQGEDRMSGPGFDRAEPGGSRPAQEGQEQRLGLVVGGMTGHRIRSEGAASGGAGSSFEVGPVVERDGDDLERDVEAFGGPAGDERIMGGAVAEPVVDVDGRDAAAGSDGEGDERGGVRPS